MKCAVGIVTLTLLLQDVSARFVKAETTPMEKVAQLLVGIKNRVEADGMLEQQQYDKYACWCEETTARKANDISTDKAIIEESQATILKLQAETASHQAEIKQTKKEIDENIEGQRDATAVRDKENADYNTDRTESEQCSGALEAAVKVLAGAGEKKAFLETGGMQQARLLSVVAGVRNVFSKQLAVKELSDKDMQVVQLFLQHPEQFVSGSKSGAMSAAQIGNNPFGDYAPQSTQIQGILKGMYDTFVGDLEKSNAEEADAQKSYEELMATKQRELQTLQETLQAHELSDAEKSKLMADAYELRDNTEVQLEADEKLFEDVKAGCKAKSTEWSQRTLLRSQELMGLGEAIKILTSDEARAKFQSAVTTLVQVGAVSHRSLSASASMELGIHTARLASLARQYHNLDLAQIAAKMKVGGHFDKVIEAIDKMMEVLRQEEQDDIAHRDRCENAQNKNSNDMEDLNHAIDKATEEISNLETRASGLKTDIATLKDEIDKSNRNMKDALGLRNSDVAAFKQAVKDDTDAIVILNQALEAVTSFYKKNKLELKLSQTGEEPVYTADKDKAPETSWSGANYGGRNSETSGVVAIMQMLIEDLEKEIKTAQADDAAAQEQYEKERTAMQMALDAQLSTKLAKEKELNDVEGKIADTDEHKKSKTADLNAEEQLKSSIYTDCTWVSTHFESRREKRKAEMDGLTEAKSYLAGVEAGDDV